MGNWYGEGKEENCGAAGAGGEAGGVAAGDCQVGPIFTRTRSCVVIIKPAFRRRFVACAIYWPAEGFYLIAVFMVVSINYCYQKAFIVLLYHCVSLIKIETPTT